MAPDDNATAACIVLVTCGSPEEADRIAETIVSERLAACVNVVGQGAPIRSFYLWDGQLQKEAEILLVIKTQSAKLPKLGERIRELHSYSVPEFIALPITAGSKAYLDWIAANTQ
jgi:periplasmic divalent cation tolerance protein